MTLTVQNPWSAFDPDGLAVVSSVVVSTSPNALPLNHVYSVGARRLIAEVGAKEAAVGLGNAAAPLAILAESVHLAYDVHNFTTGPEAIESAALAKKVADGDAELQSVVSRIQRFQVLRQKIREAEASGDMALAESLRVESIAVNNSLKSGVSKDGAPAKIIPEAKEEKETEPQTSSDGAGARKGGDGFVPTSKPWQLWSKGALLEHYEKHGAEVGATSKADYNEKALDFATRTNSGSQIDHFTGDYHYRYDPQTKEISVGTKNGTIKTYYKWDGRGNDEVINTLKNAGKIK